MNLTPLEITLLVVTGLLGVLVLLASISRPWAVRWLLIATVLVTSIGFALDYNKQIQVNWLTQVQLQRSALFAVLGVGLAGFALAQSARLRTWPVSAQGLVLLAVGVYAGLIGMAHDGVLDGLSTMGLALLSSLPLMALPMVLLRTWDDFPRIVRVVLAGHCVWLLAVAVQMAIKLQPMLQGNHNRFIGLTTNPQVAGVQLGITSILGLWAILNDRGRYRLVWLVMIAANMVFQVWTGSRTGMLVLVTGSTIVLYRRFGRAVFLVPIVVAAAYGAFVLAGMANVDLGADRLTSFQDTRSAVWARLLQTGMNNVLVGVGRTNLDASENSFLYGFAGYGLGMLALQVLLVLVTAFQMYRLWQLRNRIPPQYRGFVELLLGFNAAYFAGAMFEGYMLARIGLTMLLMFLFAGAATRLIALAQSEEGLEEEHYAEEGPHDEGAADFDWPHHETEGAY
jgi:hypothetical protein